MLGDSYASGAAVMAETLRRTGTQYQIYCMITPCVSREAATFLEEVFDRVIRVPLLTRTTIPMKSKKQRDIYGRWINHSFTKWNILNPALFSHQCKIILLDADMVFYENCDDLFDLAAPALTYSMPWTKPYANGRSALDNVYGVLDHGVIVPSKRIQKGLDSNFVGIGGMVLVEPSARTWDIYMNIFNGKRAYGHPKCLSGFDEQILSETFVRAGLTVRHIHQEYNWIAGKYNWLTAGQIPRTRQFYNSKPWLESREDSEWDDVREWYEIWDCVLMMHPDGEFLVKPVPSRDAAASAEAFSLEKK